MQVVSNLVDCFFFGLGEVSRGGVEGGFLEEKADLVAAGEEVVVADVGGGFAGGELGQGVRGEGEGGEEGVGFGKESCDRGGGDGVRDDEVAIGVVGFELLG